MDNRTCRYCGYTFHDPADLVDHMEYVISHSWANGDPLCVPQKDDD